MKDKNTIYRPVGRIVVRRIGEDRLLVPVSGLASQERAIFPINESGLFVWEHLSEGHDLEQTVQAMLREFDTDAERAQADCEQYANQLVEQKLLETVSE